MSNTNRTTPSQKEAIKLIEDILSIEYTGNTSNQSECQMFIDEYYEEAKYTAVEMSDNFDIYLESLE